MAGETQITIVGNLVDDPELRFTPTGDAVVKFRIASTPRTYDKQAGEWKDGQGVFLTCTQWKKPAENLAESLRRGDRVIVYGSLRQRSYETSEGEKRTVFEIAVDEVGPSLRYATTKIQKATKSGNSYGGSAADPWATATPTQDEEPPF